VEINDKMLLALLNQGVYDDQDKDLNQQIMEAISLRHPAEQHHTTGWGAGLGAVGNLASGIASRRDESALRAQKQQMQQAYIDALKGLVPTGTQPPSKPSGTAFDPNDFGPAMGAGF
jgi:hypothetical protein